MSSHAAEQFGAQGWLRRYERISVPETVISVENLSKRYVIEASTGARGHKRYTALRDVIEHSLGNFARNALAAARGRPVFQSRETEEFWALKL